jgi:hypothetical protein
LEFWKQNRQEAYYTFLYILTLKLLQIDWFTEIREMEGMQHGNKRRFPLGVTTRKQRKLQMQQQARTNLSQEEKNDINMARRQAGTKLIPRGEKRY